ncbi:MAG: N-acetylglucosamine-6-phosphate deacetylase [Gloeobacteraceae cyanobacterium ES-bin-144]|nr:N-acetylglucosamine-6-phosphate deacetylase [Verrucomicrobiales bacterium]
MKMLILHVRLISPDVDIADAAILIEDGRIAAVFEVGEKLPEVGQVIDGEGRIVMPGFFDIHSHGADGRDVCDGLLESVRHIARRKLQEGVTTWLPTTLTQSEDKLEEIARVCGQYMANPEFCRTPGLHVEGPFINSKNAGAQNPEFIRPPNFNELRNLNDIAPLRIVSLAPELDGANDLVRKATEIGIICSAAHTSATAEQIAEAKHSGLTHLTHFGNAMTALHHREIGVVGAGLLDDSLKLEVICDMIHLCPDMLRLVFMLVPIERLMLITDSMAASWMDKGAVMLGGLKVIVNDGKAVLAESGVLAGSALRFNEGVRNIAALTNMPLHQIVKATSWNQAQSLGLNEFGKLEAGFVADIVFLNQDFSVWKTLVGGVER